MKQKQFYLYFILLCVVFTKNLTAQSKLEISPYAGYNTTLGTFKDFAQDGYNFGISTDYFFGKKIGIGIDFNQQINKPVSPFDFSRIPDNPNIYTINRFESGNWTTSTFGIGPIYRIGNKKLNTDIYAKAGLSFINIPTYRTIFTYSGLERDLLSLGIDDNITSFGLTTGIKFNYQLNESLSLFINPQYVYTDAKVPYTYRDIDNAFGIDSNGEEFFGPGLLAEQPALEEQLDLSYFNINAGITYTFGKGKQSKKKNVANDTHQNCQKTTLLYPYHKETFDIRNENYPTFKWSNLNPNKVKAYDLNIYDLEGNTLIVKSSKKQELQADKSLLKDLKQLKNGNYKWNVTTHYQDCNSNTTETRLFMLVQGECDYVIQSVDIDCDKPAFDPDTGTVSYSGVINVQNNSSYPGVLSNHPNSSIAQHIGIDVTGATLTTSSSGPTGICPAIPVLSTPGGGAYFSGQVASYCFNLTVPIGTTSATFLSQIITQKGTNDEAICNASKTIELPSCVCNVCDENNPDGWQIISSNENIGLMNRLEGKLRTTNSFQILNADPIQQVKAEIISVEHQANDEQCYTCTKHEEDMGLIYLGRQYSATGWQNGGKGYNAYDNSATPPVYYEDATNKHFNEVTWISQNNLGVDFSTGNRHIQLHMDLPRLSSLDCCESTYKVCVRYSFTDINCQTCSKIICYEYKSTSNGSGQVNDINIGIGIDHGHDDFGAQ